MKSVHVLGLLAAAIVVAIIVTVRGRGPTPAPVVASAPAVSSSSAPLPSAGGEEPRKQEEPPEIVFLEEAGSYTPADRPRPTAMRMPVTNGNRRVANARSITSKEQGEFVSPRWSPDGLELLVSRPGFTGLFTVGANGGDVTQLTAKEGIGFGADWNEAGEIDTRSNDGERQKFNPDGTPADSVSIEEDSSRVGTFTKDDTVFYRPAPGEAPVALTTGEDRYFGGVLSPDGKHMVYNGLHTGLYVKPVDGSAPPVHLGIGTEPRWLPDSSGVVYQVTSDDGHNLMSGDLYTATVNGETVSNLTQTDNSIELSPSVSPDGTRIAFEADGQIYVGDLQ